jgi:hypothetical protein
MPEIFTGKWWSVVPKDPVENLQFRRFLFAKVKKDKSGKLAKEVNYVCSKDIKFWVNAFAFTFDPRLEQKEIPFVTFPFQDFAFDETLDCIAKGEDLVIEKVRGAGASWINCATLTHQWLYVPNSTFNFISYKEELVDKPGDPRALFSKIDLILKYLPGWMLCDKDYERKKLSYLHKNGATINGEATTGRSSVGARCTAMFIDEFSQIDNDAAERLLVGTHAVTNCRIFNFTPQGEGHASFKRLAERTDVRKLRMHWRQDPRRNAGLYHVDPKTRRVEIHDKQYPFPAKYEFQLDGEFEWHSIWFDKERTRMGDDRAMRQEYEIDYQGSTYQFFEKLKLLELQESCLDPFLEGDLDIDAELGEPKKFTDFKGGAIKLWVNLDPSGRPPLAKYGAGADISNGTGASNSCLSICNVVTGEKALEFATPFMKEDAFAEKCVAVVRWFYNAKFCWELQGPGITFGKRVLTLGYRNIYWRRDELSANPKISDIPGWVPTPKNKRLAMEQYRTSLYTGAYMNRSLVSIKEHGQFIRMMDGSIEHSSVAHTTNDPTGARTDHGDRVVADFLCDMMRRDLGGSGGGKAEPVQEAETLSFMWRRQQRERSRQTEEVFA